MGPNRELTLPGGTEHGDLTGGNVASGFVKETDVTYQTKVIQLSHTYLRSQIYQNQIPSHSRIPKHNPIQFLSVSLMTYDLLKPHLGL